MLRVTPPTPIGHDTTAGPHLLPVPLPAERRNVDTDYEFPAGAPCRTVRAWGCILFSASKVTVMEIGPPP